MHRFVGTILLLIFTVCAGNAQQFTATTIPSSATLRSEIVGFNQFNYAFENFFKVCDSNNINSAVNDDQYPTNGTLAVSITYSCHIPPSYGGNWVFAIKNSAGKYGIQGSNLVVNSFSGGTVAFCAVPPCSGLTNIDVTASSNLVLNMSFPAGTTGFTFQFTRGNTFTNVSDARFCRQADYNADNECLGTIPGGFNVDLINTIAGVRPGVIRFLDTNAGIYGLLPPWAYNPQTTNFSYMAQRYIQELYLGSATGTNTYAATCSVPCAYSLTSGAPADGDVVQGKVANANTTLATTLAVTDIHGVTSAAIPVTFSHPQGQINVLIGGKATAGDTIALTFTTTPVGVTSTCLAGGAYTIPAYTVLNTDTATSIATAVQAITANAGVPRTTLNASPQQIFTYNQGNALFNYGYANNACALTISAAVTGAQTETVFIGNISTIGGLATGDTVFVYSAVLNEWLSYPGAISFQWPWSVQIALTKAISQKINSPVGCWLETNLNWSAASIVSFVAYTAANKCLGGDWYEVSNEVWQPGNFETQQAYTLGNSLGLGQFSNRTYYALKVRQLGGIVQTAWGSLGACTHLQVQACMVDAFQQTAITAAELNGTRLCGNSCSNPAYQNYVINTLGGADYNSGAGQPHNFINTLSEAPYYSGAILVGTDEGSYDSSGNYGTWSATTASVSANVLTVSGTVTGTIYPNQGITGCDGTFITDATLSGNFDYTAQTSGTVTTTLNGATTDNQTVWTLTSVAGLSAGMWVYNATNGLISGTIGSVNAGAHQITITGGQKTYRSNSTNDTIVFGGLGGTYKLNSTSCSLAFGTQTGGDILGLQYATDNYCTASSVCITGHAGLGSVQDALNWVAQDVYSSVKNENQNAGIAQHLNSWQIANNVGSYGLPLMDYEGGYSAAAPTTSQATTMGLPSSSYGGLGGYVDLLLTAFKNNTMFKTVEAYRHTFELASLPAHSQTGWFNVEGNGDPYSFYHGDIYGPVWQSYNAVCNYNGGGC
jgi:hypothetical protein